MINQQQAERIAQAVTILRPDWLASSVTTLITRDLASWSLLDLAVGLTYVAIDRKPDGTWASKTPARVKEQGPWRVVGLVDPDQQAARDRAQRGIQERRDAISARARATNLCRTCDDEGRLGNGRLCTHDDRATQTESAGAALARRAFADARAARLAPTPEETSR